MLQTLDRLIRRIFLQNLHLKVIALLLTLALYLWVSVDREVERTRYTQLRLDVPSRMVLVNDPPTKITVTVRGKWSNLNRLESSQLEPIRVPIDPDMGMRGRISLTPDMVDLPPGLRAVDVQPNVVQFHLEKRRTKIVAIRPRVVGDLPEGYKLEKTELTPERLEISGPESSLTKIPAVSTEPIDVQGHTASFTTEARPRIEDPLVEYHLDEPLVASVHIGAQKVERTFAGLKVEPVNADSSLVASVKPTHVTVTFRGPKAILDHLDRNDLLASLDLSGEHASGPRTVEREVQIRNKPEGVELVSEQPRYFRVHLAPKQAQQHAQD